MPNLKEGLLVEHPKKPEWGPGKIILLRGEVAHVFFRDVPDNKAAVKLSLRLVDLQPCAQQSDPVLDNLPPFLERQGVLEMPRPRVTLAQMKERFLAQFPAGFQDDRYLGDAKAGERNYKLWAHETYLRLLGGGQARELLAAGELAELTRRVFEVEKGVNYLEKRFVRPALEEALRQEATAKAFFSALLDLLDSPAVTKEVFEPYARAVGGLPPGRSGGRLGSWPVATFLPFIAQPDRHMFLKPTETQEAALRLGFELNYQAEPNWRTYSAYLAMGEIYKRLLADLGPRDLIDVQSFLYVTCGGYDR